MNFASVFALIAVLASAVYADTTIIISSPISSQSYQVGDTLYFAGTYTTNASGLQAIAVTITSGTYSNSVILYDMPATGGAISSSFVLPTSPYGAYTLTATSLTDTGSASVNFSVNPYPSTIVTVPAPYSLSNAFTPCNSFVAPVCDSPCRRSCRGVRRCDDGSEVEVSEFIAQEL